MHGFVDLGLLDIIMIWIPNHLICLDYTIRIVIVRERTPETCPDQPESNQSPLCHLETIQEPMKCNQF